MCIEKDEAKTKADRLIASMDRLATALEALGLATSGPEPSIRFDRLYRNWPDAIASK